MSSNKEIGRKLSSRPFHLRSASARQAHDIYPSKTAVTAA